MGTARRCRAAVVSLVAIASSAAAGTVYAAPSVPDQGAKHEVYVEADRPWNNTKIWVEEGQTFTIEAFGTVEISPGAAGTTPNGREGCIAGEGWLVPEATCYSLVGRTADSEPTEIDDFGGYYAKETGYIYLGVNDENDVFFDNSGAWRVEITVD